MNQKPTPPQQPLGIALSDIYYVLFRRKWLILAICGISLAAALVVRLTWRYTYQSQAELYIRYISFAKPIPTEDTKVLSLEDRNDPLSTEVQLLKSGDLAVAVAKDIGPAKILKRTVGGTNVFDAAAQIMKGLQVEVPPRTQIISLQFACEDPDIVGPVLTDLIDTYKREHDVIRATHSNKDDAMQIEAERIEERLNDTERQLRVAMSNANVISLEDANAAFAAERRTLESELMDSEAELAQHQATIAALERSLPARKEPEETASGSALATNVDQPPPPADKVRKYKTLRRQMDIVQNAQDGLLIQYTTNNEQVRANEQILSRLGKEREALETEYPLLADGKPEGPMSRVVNDGTPVGESLEEQLNGAKIKAQGVAARILTYSNLLVRVNARADTLNQAAGPIADLQRLKQIQEEQYTAFEQKVEQMRLDDEMDPTRVSNITVAQSPLPPVRIVKPMKTAFWGILCVGFAAAFGMAFMIELYINRSFKHAAEVRTRIPLPFFLSIPFRRTLENLKLSTVAGRSLPNVKGEEGPEAAAVGSGELQPFHEALRDRLIAYFEMINLTHKPKLVAVTSSHRGAGVTTIATGLASSLSETGEGNVLLVNMGSQDSEAHHFYKGKLTCGLDEALEKDKREGAQIQGKLYLASDFDPEHALPRMLPKRFGNLVPKMKASDFDYIIFDMPAVSQISITPRLARFMDMILFVVESEKTDRDAAKRAMNLLMESKTNVGVVLNKSKSYLPRWIQSNEV